MPRCNGCGRDDFTFQGLQSHRRQTQNPLCIADIQERALPGLFDENPAPHIEDDFSDDEDDDDDGQDVPLGGPFFEEGGDEENAVVEMEEDDDGNDDDEDDEDENDSLAGNVDYDEGPGWEPPPLPVPVAPVAVEADPPPPPAGRQHVEDSLRQEIFVEHYPSACAGKPIRQTAPSFSSYGAAEANNPYAPFPTRMDWEIARWGKIFGPGSNAMDRLLAIKGVPEALGLSYHTTRQINKVIDALPASRPRFHCKEVTVGGEAFEVYYRDSLECVKALYGDPSLAADLIFKPEKHYTDADHKRMYHDMHTGTWWWDAQRTVELDHPGSTSATIVPIIISSDKTRLTQFKGKSAYPVYMTIGNLPKEVRRKPSMQGQILLAYLPTSRLEHITVKAARRRSTANLFHACMRKILQPLHGPGNDGVELTSGDGVVRKCYPIFAAHVGDYPEQVLVTGVKTGQCPCCNVPADSLGDHNHDYGWRNIDAVLNALRIADDMLRKNACSAAGIKPIHQPYWQDLPYANPFRAITPDILHQLYQGVIKHLVAWIKTAYSEAEIDARCRRLPKNHHVRVFTKGISSLYQLTGREHADIARILLGLIIDMPLPGGASPVRLVRAVRAILDFLYLAQYPVHTTETLSLLDDALDRFHDNKDIFMDLGVRNSWAIPKLHFLRHYSYFIRRLGTTDNYNTESTERLHIDLAKDAYAATNAKDEFPQMTLWLERREKLFRHENYIGWCLDGRPARLPSRVAHGPPADRLQMTKHPSQKAITFERVAADYGAPFFVDALARYIVKWCNPEYTPAQVEQASNDVPFLFRSVPVYHKAKMWLGDLNNHRILTDEFDVIHATPSRKDKRGRTVDGHFDTVMVNDGIGGSSGIAGYRVAQIRVIFTLPKGAAPLFGAIGLLPPQYLAYVEWFTAFGVPDVNHRLFKIKRVVRDGDRLASIISLRAIRRSVYLFPMFGPVAPRDWTSGNVLDRCSTFYVDSLSDRHAFHTIH